MEPTINLERFGTIPNSRPAGRLEPQLRCLIRFLRAIKSELRYKSKLPMKTRLKAWSLGFSSAAWELYKLEHNDPALFIPDIRATWYRYKVNGFFNPIIGNKLILSRLLTTHQIPHPAVVSIVLDGKLLEEDRAYERDLAGALSRTLDRYPRQVFRPTWSGGGQGVFFLDRDDTGLKLNGETVTNEEVVALLSRLDRYLSTQFHEQAGYARDIFPGSTNTLRIVSLWDSESGEAVIAAVAHRFGMSHSGKLDSFHSGLGGVSAAVDSSTGTIGRAIMRMPDGEVVSISHHPDTSQPIEGVTIPGFHQCLETLKKTACHFPFCPWIGWDVVITEDGFRVLEANTLPSFTVTQVHTPLLKDPGTKRIFQRWGLAR